MPQKQEKNYFSWIDLIKSIWFLWDFGKARKKYLLLFILLFFILLYSIVPALIVGKIVSFFTNYLKGDSLMPLYFYSALLGVSYAAVSLARLKVKKSLTLLRNNTEYHIRVKGFEIFAAEPLFDSKDETTGEKTQKIHNGTASFNDFFHLLTNNILSFSASLIGIISVFIFLSPVFAAFFAVYFCVFFIILNIFYKKISNLSTERNKALEQASGMYVEGLSNILVLKASGSEKAFQSRIITKENITKEFKDKIVSTANNQWKTFQVWNGMGMAVFLLLVGRGIITGSLTIAEIVIFFSYLEKLIAAADNFMSIYSGFIESKTGIGRLMDIFHKDISQKGGDSPFPLKWKKIIITDGNFFYANRDSGINKINMEIRNGEQIGIAGETGSGKSTIAKVLLGLYPLNSGKYFIDNIDFYKVKLEEIKKNISIVLQETEMFSLSVEENITLLRKINPETFEKAVRTAELEELIEKLPQRLSTLIGEKGYRLSGGERQRIGIARALCAESQILILDEATSSLDGKTERLIYEHLEKEFSNKTVIIIAHRVDTLNSVDKIYIFHNGHIVEDGKFKELQMNPNSFFNRIYPHTQ